MPAYPPFELVRQGYRADDVDDYVRDVTERLQALTDEKTQMQRMIAVLTREKQDLLSTLDEANTRIESAVEAIAAQRDSAVEERLAALDALIAAVASGAFERRPVTSPPVEPPAPAEPEPVDEPASLPEPTGVEAEDAVDAERVPVPQLQPDAESEPAVDRVVEAEPDVGFELQHDLAFDPEPELEPDADPKPGPVPEPAAEEPLSVYEPGDDLGIPEPLARRADPPSDGDEQDESEPPSLEELLSRPLDE